MKTLIFVVVLIGSVFASPINNAPTTVKERLLATVNNEEKRIHKSATELRKESLNYYADRLLSMLQPYLKNILLEVQRLPADADEKRAFQTTNNVRLLLSEVEHEIRENSHDEKIKSGALYMAAMKSTTGLLGPTALWPKQLKADVQLIVDKENSHLGIDHTVGDRRLFLDRADVRELVSNLADKLKNYPIRTAEENRKLEKSVADRIAKMNKVSESEAIRGLTGELSALKEKRHLMNSLLPIDSAEKIEQYFSAAEHHFVSSRALESYLVMTESSTQSSV